MVLMLAGITGFYSCEKDEETTGTRDLIVNNIWAYDSLEVSDTSNTGLLLAAVFTHEVYKDSEYDFSDDGTYTLTSSQIDKDGTWELIDNKVLLMDKGTEDEAELEILQLDNTIAKLSMHAEGNFFGLPFSGQVILLFKAK